MHEVSLVVYPCNSRESGAWDWWLSSYCQDEALTRVVTVFSFEKAVRNVELPRVQNRNDATNVSRCAITDGVGFEPTVRY